MTAPVVTKPTPLGEESDKTDELIHLERIKEYVKRTGELQSNLAAIHAIAWGRCSETLRVKSLEGYYKEKFEENDCVWLLSKIQAVMQHLHVADRRSR